jgi:hypothetical protein
MGVGYGIRSMLGEEPFRDECFLSEGKKTIVVVAG